MLPYSYTVTLLILTFIYITSTLGLQIETPLFCVAIFCPLNKIFSAEDSQTQNNPAGFTSQIQSRVA